MEDKNNLHLSDEYKKLNKKYNWVESLSHYGYFNSHNGKWFLPIFKFVFSNTLGTCTKLSSILYNTINCIWIIYIELIGIVKVFWRWNKRVLY